MDKHLRNHVSLGQRFGGPWRTSLLTKVPVCLHLTASYTGTTASEHCGPVGLDTCRMAGLPACCWIACGSLWGKWNWPRCCPSICQWTNGLPSPPLSASWHSAFPTPDHLRGSDLQIPQRSHDQPQGASLGKASLWWNLKLFSLGSLIPLPFFSFPSVNSAEGNKSLKERFFSSHKIITFANSLH